MEALGDGAARKINAAILDFLPGNDAAGAFKKGDGSQQCYTPPTAVLSRALADQSMKVLTHAADAGFVVFCIEGKYETELLLQRVSWMSRLDACSTSAAFAHPYDADPYLNGVNGCAAAVSLIISSPAHARDADISSRTRMMLIAHLTAPTPFPARHSAGLTSCG
mmetsp:Transcript_20425/g.51103  ORF Transcript_20425/g.51103 Transcript_20425/m.51103 type:complete len:165 (+) Transcript_20425:1119-1613(+)